ncbi:hypothetical protein [Kutzneria sp. CA-103260]|uniref:hypothetical protein n=1 Tax=Kutzneria sp. CA-103260 TaxID=2802641 RepID=UPI001BA8A3E2|nr:hypothetical protein [Kutzneria sp. CA-103260]QUQ70326.1 hypothetical protein JJ691_81010 [Kutzneria sp. CA-103260]
MVDAIERLSGWSLVAAIGVLLFGVHMLVRLVISKRPPRQGDDVIIRVLPPRIEIRYRGPDQDEAESAKSVSTS